MSNSLTALQRKFVLITAILASSMAFIDSTALNVALPALQRSLNLDGLQLLWVVNAYTLMLAAFTLLGGALGDVMGKRRVFMLGIAGFSLFSALCGISENGGQLIIFRALHGLAAALMVPGSLSLITASFDRKERGRAIGTWSMFSSLTTIMGPVLGGYLAAQGWWRAIFYINVPLGLFSLLILWWKVDEPVAPHERKLDWTGSLLSALAFSLITYGFIKASENGFQQTAVWLSLTAGLLALAAFIWWENRVTKPMLPLRLFRSPTFSGANLMTLFVYGALTTVLFFLPLNLIQVQGYPEDLAGLAILPFGATIALMARMSGTWTDKVGPKKPLVIGPLITALGFFLLSTAGMTTGTAEYWSSFFPGLLTAGLGMGLTVVPLTTSVMNCVDDQSAGIASGVNNTVSRLAGVLVLAVVGAMILFNFREGLIDRLQKARLSEQQLNIMQEEAQKLAEAKPPESWSQQLQNSIENNIHLQFIEGFEMVCYAGAGLCLAGALLSWFLIEKQPKTMHVE